jgi:hypothetical protein
VSISKVFPQRLDQLFIDVEHRVLAERLLNWARSHSSAPQDGEHVCRAFYASTFGYLCAPRSATHEQIFVSLKFLTIFFLVDDLVAERMSGIALQLMEHMHAEPGSDFARYYIDLMSDLARMGRATEMFDRALRDMIVANEREKTASFSVHDEDEVLALRKVVVGIPAYIACWAAIRGVSLLAERPRLAKQLGQLLDITCELACLVNDIASLARDAEGLLLAQPGLVDLNLVLLLMQKAEPEAYARLKPVAETERSAELAKFLARARETALPASIARYNAKVWEFYSVERELHAASSSPAVRAYLESLHCAIVGDLRSSKHLVSLRYPEALTELDKLHSLDEFARSA